ncbi:hypothetical protein [Arthrobacter sp. Ld5]|uniref:hypothetical protein n=1 Tax=Arthrobacter sp. Ld5 TaxID=649152 RepID=UPI003EBDF9F4
MHYRHNNTTRENGRHCCTKFETSQKNQPPHGVRQPANSTNQKTIGINKLGTLLSSQTTGTTVRNQPKKPATTRGAATSKFNQSKNNRYQQTWHTIEFSNNRNNRHHTRPNRHVLAPEQLFKLTRTDPVTANPPILMISALHAGP